MDKKEYEKFKENEKTTSFNEISGSIAHEINNPLGFIKSNLNHLNKNVKKLADLIAYYDGLNLSDREREATEQKKEEINFSYIEKRIPKMIEDSITGVDMISRVILNLKSFSKYNTEKITSVDINKAIDAALNVIAYRYTNKIKVLRDYANLPEVECNIGKLNQVILNLFINACHSIEGEGEVKIKTSQEDNFLKIEIIDSGTGISDDILEKIFEPFFTTKEEGKGTGLGLFISKDIINELNGDLSVSSIVGQGTTFTIKIPF